jgi:hypothetical protein
VVCKSQFNGKRILEIVRIGNGANPERANLLAKIAGPAVAKAKVEAKRNTRFN